MKLRRAEERWTQDRQSDDEPLYSSQLIIKLILVSQIDSAKDERCESEREEDDQDGRARVIGVLWRLLGDGRCCEGGVSRGLGLVLRAALAWTRRCWRRRTLNWGLRSHRVWSGLKKKARWLLWSCGEHEEEVMKSECCAPDQLMLCPLGLCRLRWIRWCCDAQFDWKMLLMHCHCLNWIQPDHTQHNNTTPVIIHLYWKTHSIIEENQYSAQ